MTRRGLFRLILALPFAPKCIQAFRGPRINVIPDAPFTLAPSAGIHGVGAPFLDQISTLCLQCDRDVFKAESGGYGDIFPARNLRVGDIICVRKPARFRA